MTRGRTASKYTRVYIDGYDMSGYARNIGPLSESFEEGKDDPLNTAVIGTWMGQPSISPGTLNALFDNTATSGAHAVLNTPGALSNVMVPIGIQAIPALGDPVFMGQFQQDDYLAQPEQTPAAITVRFGVSAAAPTTDISLDNYEHPWGVLLHPYGAETGPNAAIGIDLADYGYGTSDTSSDGGWMMYQVFAASGAGHTANIKVQDATTNLDAGFADLLTTGLIDVGTAPVAGVVELATTADVRQYVRWQVALGTATSVTFALGFVRGRKR